MQDAAAPTKRCPKCGVRKPPDAFDNSSKTKDKLQGYCRECKTSYSRERYLRVRSPERNEHYRLYQKYRLGRTDKWAMEDAQQGQCAICSEVPPRGLVVDHDHKTGKVRALLCSNCNTGLGLFDDRPALLWAAAEYLKKHSTAG